MNFEAEVARIAAEHAAASEQIRAEIARMDEESATQVAAKRAAEAAEAAAQEPTAAHIAELSPGNEREPHPDEWEDDDESRFYRPSSWLI